MEESMAKEDGHMDKVAVLSQFTFNWVFWLRSDSSKIVLIPTEYLSIYYIIISIKYSFGAPTSLKKSLRAKLCLITSFGEI